MKRESLLKLVTWILDRTTHLEYSGLENIPSTGPVIIATNHISRFDTPVLFRNPARPDITALVTDKYQSYPFFKWFTTTAGGIWIDRTKADFAAFRLASQALVQGKALGISPEGTRSTNAQLLEGKSGAVLLALKNNVPVVPVGICGTETIAPSWKRLRKPLVKVKFGKLLVFPALERENRDEQLAGYTAEIMCQIAATLPPGYHGFYAGHPRLVEILDGKQDPSWAR